MSSSYNTTKDGEIITIQDGSLKVPDKPIIPFIEGDGIGADVWRASRRVLDAAIEKAYDNQRAINWVEALAGEKAFNKTQIDNARTQRKETMARERAEFINALNHSEFSI